MKNIKSILIIFIAFCSLLTHSIAIWIVDDLLHPMYDNMREITTMYYIDYVLINIGLYLFFIFSVIAVLSIKDVKK